jgi:hypothetical protein
MQDRIHLTDFPQINLIQIKLCGELRQNGTKYSTTWVQG